MKILATGDWHIGNLFHGNDRLPEHRHFLGWLLAQIGEQQPDALLVAGDVFDNGNPSALAQSAYYAFLADATQLCPHMQIVITAGNHDSASRLEAPRALLTRHRVEIRGNVHRVWKQQDDAGTWEIDYDDLMIPISGDGGHMAVILAVPYLRADVIANANYSQGVNVFLRTLTEKARQKFPNATLVMMAHMYAKGADIAPRDASERIVIGGQEEVNMDGWTLHPDYMTCGHIHKRQPIWHTGWARYTGSVLPMSFAEKDYRHGIDMVSFEPGEPPCVTFLEYVPQHRLRVLPEGDEELTPRKIRKLIDAELTERTDGKLADDFVYLVLKVKIDKVNNDEIHALEALVETRNAVLCKIQKVMPQMDLSTVMDHQRIYSMDDVLNRDPLDTIKEAFAVKNSKEMSESQEAMLRELLGSITTEDDKP